MTVRLSRTPLAAAFAACFALAPPALAVAAPSTSTSSTRAVSTAKSGINTLRARTGHHALSSSASLDRGASVYARTMLRQQYFGHAAHMHVSRRFHLVGEALALQPGRRPRGGTAVRMWAHSAMHRAILTSGQFRKIGVGAATGRFHGRTVTMWVARVGR